MGDKDIPCRCGHDKAEHKPNYTGAPNLVCKATQDEGFDWADDCMDYIPDNLLHIERIAKKRKLI